MSIIEVKNRIKAVKNIGQITKAMEVVAATKMRKSQQVALNSRPYAFKALQLLSVLAQNINVSTSQVGTFGIKADLMKIRLIKKTLVVIVTSDRGLAGSFNSQVLRSADSFLKSYDNVPTSSRFRPSQSDGNEIEDPLFANGELGQVGTLKVITVGKKAIAYANKRKINLVARFSGFGDFVEPQETNMLADVLINGFLNIDWDRVITISTHFRSTLKQEVLTRQVLPVDLEKIQQIIKEIIPE